MTQATPAPRATATSTPRADGFRLPARFTPHQRTLLSWPCREDLFGPLMDDARKEWAEVARGIARFEPVTVVVDPAQEAEARELLGHDVDLLPDPARRLLDPRQRPHLRARRRRPGRDGALPLRRLGRALHALRQGRPVPAAIADAWGVRRYEAPFVLEGGAFNTDGEGTLLTTEQCLLHHRNLGCSRGDNEALLKEWLGVEKVIWLPYGLVEDSGPLSTSGHVDDVAQFVAPGVVLAQTCEPDNLNYSRLQENLEGAGGGDGRRRTPPRGRRVAAPALRERRGRRAGRSQRARRRHPHAGALREHGLRGGRRPPAAHR